MRQSPWAGSSDDSTVCMSGGMSVRKRIEDQSCSRNQGLCIPLWRVSASRNVSSLQKVNSIPSNRAYYPLMTSCPLLLISQTRERLGCLCWNLCWICTWSDIGHWSRFLQEGMTALAVSWLCKDLSRTSVSRHSQRVWACFSIPNAILRYNQIAIIHNQDTNRNQLQAFGQQNAWCCGGPLTSKPLIGCSAEVNLTLHMQEWHAQHGCKWCRHRLWVFSTLGWTQITFQDWTPTSQVLSVLIVVPGNVRRLILIKAHLFTGYTNKGFDRWARG